MEFCVLGNLEVRQADAQVVLGSYKQRSLLSLLLIHANEVVSADRIIDELWGDELVPGRQNALWVHVSNLRSALEPDRLRGSPGSILLTRAPGYLLHLDPEAIDSCRFQALVGEGRRLLDLDPPAASIALGEGLHLWRGRPYADVAYESFAQVEIGRLDELRLEAVELRVDADLRRGLAAELIGELESLAAQHPLRERFTALLMLALYRAGRQSEALRAFERLRARLGEDLGIVPSPALAELERRILGGDRSLDHDHALPSARTRLAVRGYEVREPIGESPLGTTYRAYQPAVGREVAITILGPEVANDADFIRRFDAEAELVARLEHPHIVPLYDYWREPDAAYLVTRDVRGGNLVDLVTQGSFDEAQAARLARDIGSALSLAHRSGVIHGAVNPTSIVIDEDGAAYLRDFTVSADERPVGDRALATAVKQVSPYAAPEQRRGEPVCVESDTYSLAMVLAYALSGREPASLRALGLRPAIARVLHQATAADVGERFRRAEALTEAFEAAVGVAAIVTTPSDVGNPYKGLHPFGEPDAPDFFGRERLVERLVTRLGEGGARGRFLALVGPSGCGKSSVVHAGLVPALRDGAAPGSHEWFITTFSPGSDPFEELHGALLRVAIDPPPDLMDQLVDGVDGVRHVTHRLVRDEYSQLLLVIDQFEELFTQTNPATAQRFLDALSSAIDDPHGRVRVVLTVRADFYDRPLRHRAIGELMRHGTELVTPMSPQEVERAITGPAERVGARFDRGLVAEIVADVAEYPGALPLLQYALTEIFDKRRHGTMELTAYREIGGLAAALVRRADELYDSFDAEAQRATRQVLLRMITIGDSTEDLRRRVARQDLRALGGPAVDRVLECFGAHRLLSFDHDPVTRVPTVAVAHEALLTEWDRLRGWIDESRADLHLERQLANASGEWQAAGCQVEYLLAGSRLGQLAGWAETTDLALHPVERAFIDASVAHRDEQRAADELRRFQEVRLKARSRRRTRMLVAGGVVLALTTALAVYALEQRDEAQRLAGDLADTGEARRLAAAATLTAEDEPEMAMLLALDSLDVSARTGIPAPIESEEALHWSLQAAHVPYGHPEAPVEVRVGPNGPTGIVRLPLRDLVDLAVTHLGSQRLTDDECARFGIAECPTSATNAAWPAIPAEPSRPALPAQDGRPLAGTRIAITGAMDPGVVQADLDAFRERTGIEVSYETPNLDADTSAMSARGVPLDLMVFATTAAIRDSAAAGDLIDLASYLDTDRARETFGDYAVDAATLDSGYYAAPMFSGMKGLVWYPLREFAAAGYTAPRTWAEMVGLSDRMVADGKTPWCLGLESEAFSGWPGTDWIEALVLRLGGVDAYDRWVAGDLRFDDPIVRQAFDMFGEIAFADGFVRYGTDAISRTSVFDAMEQLTTDPPGCWLNNTGYWMGKNVRDVNGGEAGFFVLPPIEAGGETPVLGSWAMLGAFRDRPEIREFVHWMLDPTWGAQWAADPNDTFLSPNVHFDPQNCRAPDLADDVNAVRVELCEAQRDTLLAGLQRPDASDEMPPEVGGVTYGGRGAFLQGMLDFVDEGPASLDQILESIDAA